MKPGSFQLKKILPVLLIAGVIITLLSWDFKQDKEQHPQQSFKDTVPQKSPVNRNFKVRNLDEAIQELDAVDIDKEMEKAMAQVGEAMKQFDGAKIQAEIAKSMNEVNVDKIKAEVAEALKQVDGAKIQAEVAKALKEVDIEKIKLEVANSIKEIDTDKINAEIANALKEVDIAKIQAEVSASLAKIDWKEMNKSLENVKNIDFEKMKKEMEDMKPRMKEELEKAKIEIEKARVTLRDYKVVVDGLDSDGLISKNESYKINHKDGKLLINGKEASATTYEKYKSILQKKGDFTIEKGNDTFNIKDEKNN